MWLGAYNMTLLVQIKGTVSRFENASRMNFQQLAFNETKND